MEIPPSPSDSAYDLSDDEEDEYNTIMHSTSGRGVKLLFSKSKVYVHPTPSSKDNIPGYIALIQQKPSSTLTPVTSTEDSAATIKPATASHNRTTSTASTASAADRRGKSSSFLLSWVPESSLAEPSLRAYSQVEETSISPASSALDPDENTETTRRRKIPLVPQPPTSSASSSPVGYQFAVPLSEVYSLLIRPPSIGWWYGSVVINTRSGDSFPALFFHDDECQSTILQRKKKQREQFDPFGESGGMFWGGDEVLRWMKKYVEIIRSGADPNVFLVEPSGEDLLGFSSSGDTGKNKFPDSPTFGKKKDAAIRPGGSAEPAGLTGGKGGGSDASMDPFTNALKQARWGFLERMSQVTTFTRRTAQDIVENPKMPVQVRRLMRNPDVQTLQDEYDSARVYLARWAMGIAEQGEKDRFARIWSAREVLDLEDGELGEFEILDADTMSLQERRRVVTMKEWKGWFHEGTGRLMVTVEEVKERIFHGGLDEGDGVRREAWLFLLGVYEWDSTADERMAMMNSRRDEFVRLKGAWWERLMEGKDTPDKLEWWREQKLRIEKDVHRTDRHIPLFEGEDIAHPDPDSPFADIGTNVHLEQMKDMLLTYNEYNEELGYVQGMSDLLAPIYAVMQDDAVAFWGFACFMDRMERNFLRDQSGMRAQLLALDQLVALMDPKLYLHLQKADSTNFFFFYRMLLVWYKREFEWHDILRLWEGLWTDYMSSQFHIFIALAILEKHRDVIMKHLRGFDEILKYINELSNKIDLDSTLIRAEALFRRFQRTVEAIDKKNNFPAAPNVIHRKAVSTSSTSPNAAGKAPARQGQASGSDARTAQGATDAQAVDKEKIITPELRGLLSKKVIVLDKKDVNRHGGGVGGVGT